MFLLQLNVDTYATDGKIDEIRKARGYSYEDEVRMLAFEMAIRNNNPQFTD